MTTLIVGDIHGCFDELMHLVAKADFAPSDLIVSVGDLVDRGPKSYEVVRYFASDSVHRLAVLGNHEEKHIKGERPETADPSGRIVKRTVSAAQYQEMLGYLRTLPLFLDLPEVLVVHAGLEPGVPLDRQKPAVLTGRGSQGRPGFDGKSTPWYDNLGFSWPKPVVFGHVSGPEVVRGLRYNVWGLDTGAAVGGALTGLIVPEFRVVSEPTPDYYAESLRHWLPVFLVEDLAGLPWRTVLSLVAADWPAEVGERIIAAQEMYGTVVARLEREVGELVVRTRWSSLDPEAKGRIARGLRGEPRFATPLGRLLLHCFPVGPTLQLIEAAFPTPEALARALTESSPKNEGSML